MPDHFHRLAASLDPTTRGWAALFGGDLVLMALSFATGILVARALGPAEFGVYAVLAAAVGIGGAVADLGLSNAGVYRVASVWLRDPELARQRGRSFFWARVGGAAVVAAAAMALARWLAPALGFPPAVGPYRSSTLLALAFAGVAATALSGAVSVLLQATGRFGRIGIVLLTNAGLTLVLAVALSVVGRINLVTILVALGIVPSLAAFGVGRTLLAGSFSLALPPWARLRDEGAKLLRFGGWLWVASILTAIAGQLDEPTANLDPKNAEIIEKIIFSLKTAEKSTIIVVTHDPAQARLPAYHPDTSEVRHDWAQYHDKITEMDAHFAKRLNELHDAGLADDTIVFFFGDNGSGMPRSKRWPYNSGLNVPLIIRVPPRFKHLAPADYAPGGATDRLVGFVDFAPTLVSLAGAQPPDWMQGAAFMGGAEQRLGRESAHHDDQLRVQQFDLAQQERLALRDFRRFRIAVARRATLEHVGDVDRLRRIAGA